MSPSSRAIPQPMLGEKPRVAVIYDGFPHYRKGVIEELAASDTFDYVFFGDPVYRDPSIKPYDFEPGIEVLRTDSFSLGPFHVQTKILNRLLRQRVSHCIFLGNPWFLSYWALTPLLRLLGKKVYFWSHGWLSEREPVLRRAVKELFFQLPNGLLLYGCRARAIGLSHGFAASRLHVINNSLDYKSQKKIFDGLREVSQGELRHSLQLPLERKIIICTARVTQKCRFDLLLDAAAELKAANQDPYLLIVGDGPERETLAAKASSMGVAHQFRGACYDEVTLAQLHKAADLTVSPGKVGLTAMHSMAYGTPVISHDDLDSQMPECEAIVPGVTGDFFAVNSSQDLARAILKWFQEHPEKPERACIERIEASFTPNFQRRMIERALQGRMP
jgi:glycosyltransferase involved in cell wall biosynthesis